MHCYQQNAAMPVSHTLPPPPLHSAIERRQEENERPRIDDDDVAIQSPPPHKSGGRPPRSSRVIPPPPPPLSVRKSRRPLPKNSPCEVSVPITVSNQELNTKAKDLFYKCLQKTIPTGNLYSGGLGPYYLFLEHALLQQQQQTTTAVRTKRLLERALEGARRAANRFQRTASHQRSCVLSLLGDEWVGSHALLAVCYRRLEEFRTLNHSNDDDRDHPLSPQQSPRSSRSVLSPSSETSSPNSRRSEKLVDRILYRLEQQHLFFSTENDDATLVWNQDVLGGRAGALQTIWWLRTEFRSVSLGHDLVVSLVGKIVEEGLSTAASMFGDSDHHQQQILFWVCDTQGSHKSYMGAARGVVGILHTLLGLDTSDWKAVETEIPLARTYLRNTIDAFLPNHDLYQRLVDDGNLRPTLDASSSQRNVDWSHGATGLAMMLLEAARVYQSKKYAKEAHRLCDAVIYPRGWKETRTRGHPKTSYNKKGPVGLAGMAMCFLQLSHHCSDDAVEEPTSTTASKIRLPETTSLRKLWAARSRFYAQRAYKEWTNYIEQTTPTTTGVWNAFSLYEGMGALVSVMWQLSSKTMFPQLPLYGTPRTTNEAPMPLLLSSAEVSFLPTVATIPTAPPPKTPSRSPKPHEEALAESRRRKASEPKARKQTLARNRALEAARQKEERDAVLVRRNAELEARKRTQLLARKRASEAARQKEERDAVQKAQEAQKKQEEDALKRQALMLARKTATERADARRRASERAEQARAEGEAHRKTIEAERKRAAAQKEARKRTALLEARLRRQAKEAEMAKKQQEELLQKEQADRLRRLEQLQQKEEARTQKQAEFRRRQKLAAERAKAEERQKVLREAAERQQREHELKQKEEERRRRMAIAREKRRTELANRRAASSTSRLEAKETRQRGLRDEHEKRQNDVREEKLRLVLQQALDKEVEKQLREERCRQLREKNEKPDPPKPPVVYSPSFLDKKTANPAHFSAPTRSSLFWSLQTDSHIGNSDEYRPALVVDDSQFSSPSTSPRPIAQDHPTAKDLQGSTSTLPTAPLSTATK